MHFCISQEYFSVEEIRKDYPHYLGGIFEKVSRELLIELNKMRLFRFSKIGKWWSKKDEIDLVALSEDGKKALLVEVNFKELEERDVERIVGRFERKVERSEFENYEKLKSLQEKLITQSYLESWRFDRVVSQS